MGVLNIRLPPELDERLAREAKQAEKPRSELAREAIVCHLQQLERDRFNARLAAAAHTIAEDPAMYREAKAMAEDFREADDETLEPDAGSSQVGAAATDSASAWWR